MIISEEAVEVIERKVESLQSLDLNIPLAPSKSPDSKPKKEKKKDA